MICIDGEKGSWTFDNLPEGAEKVTAIFAPGAYHEEVIKWQGKIIVVPYGVKKGSVQKEIRKRWGKSIPAGGNALNGAVAIFLMRSLIRIYVFVGNNLSFKEDELFYFNQETDRDDKAYFIMNNIYGEEVLTDMPMYQYKVWLEQACNQYFPECVFINASEGILGVDVDGSNMDIFQYMPLDIAIEHIKEALDFDLLDPIEKNRVFYQKLYDDSDYNPTNGNRTWESILRLIGRGDITIEKGLDVGCGTGGGVKLARDNGYDVYGCDISNNERIWKENGIGDFCKQAPANNMPYEDNSFNFVYCGDVMEHIPEEYLLPTLKEIYRVGSHKFLFVICTALERSPVGVTTPVYTHISVKTADEWKKMICSVGYKIAQIETIDDHVAFKAVKE
jgi:ubiquinone/menaquinone biosynthesis C-methylase UbiE